MTDVVIIGAGVIGAAVARELSKYKLNITVLERECDVAMGATSANSGIVHAGFDAKPGTLKARFNLRGSLLMEEYCKSLGVKYKRCGSLVVGFDEDDLKTLKSLLLRGEENGVSSLKILSGDEVRAIEPNIGAGVKYALHAPTGAIVCPYELCMAALGSAMDNGAELLLNFDVSEISRSDGKYTVRARDGREVSAEVVINAAGVYSDFIATLVGECDFKIGARRGEYMLLDKKAGGLVKSTVFRCPSKAGKGILVTPTVDGNLMLGPTAEEIPDKDDTSSTVIGLAKIKEKASEQVSGIDTSKVITSFSGLRAGGDSGDFIINRRAGFINLAGIESPGLTASPAIAEYAAELVGEVTELSLRSDFVSERRPMHWFSLLSREEKNEIIKKSPEYAKIVCRCELISEGEILDAIRTNPGATTVDGVKRRTRATMGRCQGGFCTPRIVELLAEELGVSPLEITKRGGESYINVGVTKEGLEK
jgi:glycerol-3-phosphate dehydrogenase